MQEFDDVKASIKSGVMAQQSGDFALAEKYYLDVLSRDPANSAVAYLLSQVSAGKEGAGHLSELDYLRSVFRNYQSHYSSVLPYNLNWIVKDTRSIDAFLQDNPIVVFDIGARGADLKEIEGLRSHICYFGFDADEAECTRINASPPPGFRDFKVYPYFLGRDSGWVCFHLYKAEACSSGREPGKRYKSLFSPGLDIEKTIALKSERLDYVISNNNLLSPDLIKIDTQGSELEIMQGGIAAISSALMIEVEVEFIEMYEGQPTFNNVDAFMKENGFELLYLNRVFQNRFRYPGESRGQLVFGDALYGRCSDLEKVSAVRLAKYATLLINYGHIDVAYDIWLDFPQVREVACGLATYFKLYESTESRLEKMNRDKLICWLLHERKTNQLPIDSDRSWPIR